MIRRLVAGLVETPVRRVHDAARHPQVLADEGEVDAHTPTPVERAGAVVPPGEPPAVGSEVELSGVIRVKGDGFDIEAPFDIEVICGRLTSI
jgi:hypothetical protein